MQKILLTTALSGLILASCNKSLLNTSPEDKYTENSFWTTSEAVNAGLTACYAVLRDAGQYGGDATALIEETASPNAYNYGNTISFNSIAKGQQSASVGGIVDTRWSSSYKGIGRCNTFLAKSEPVEMDEALKIRMKGEAHFLRALYYFTLQTYYGDVPLILDPPDKNTQARLPRTPRAEVIAQVLRDLDSAAALLPLSQGKDNAGRATKGAALALKARVLLFEASPLFNTGNKAEKWKAAADAAKAVMDLGAGNKLFSDYRALFLPQNENNEEVLFDVQFMYPDQGNSFDLICRQYNTNAPLLELANTYYMKNGLPITNPASGYDPAKPYDNRDPRLYATIVYPGDIYMGVPVTNSRFASTGYGMKKYSIYDREKPPADKADLKGGQSETNYIILRYADILLMYAEAQNEFAGPDPSVFKAINDVRARAGVEPVKTSLTKDELRAEIHHERRVEFAGEGTYYNDIRRWKRGSEEMNLTIHNYNGSVIETRQFNPARDYWWPIPLGERDLNPELKQNPLY